MTAAYRIEGDYAYWVKTVKKRAQNCAGFWVVPLVVILALARCTGQELRKDKLPRFPKATLLMGYPPGSLIVTTGDTTSEVQAGGGDWYVTPSISADGRLIASARIADDVRPSPRPRPLLTIGIYFLSDKSWRDYRNLEILGGKVAISADGSQLACITRRVAQLPLRIQFLDLKTGAVSIGPDSTTNAGDIAWSPDGRRIAFVRDVERPVKGEAIPPLRAIYVLDVETGTVLRIADGMSPSWSPSGEWIAFYDYQPGRDHVKRGWYADNANRVSVIHPDGTTHKVLVTFHRDESLNLPPVWSPNSESILINKYHDYDSGTMDIYVLDLASQKLTKKFAKTLPIYGWVAAK
jgi:dipeptidyl aminopeptidase/acylaminoacyl peptidase